jgi:hypothetical protein
MSIGASAVRAGSKGSGGGSAGERRVVMGGSSVDGVGATQAPRQCSLLGMHASCQCSPLGMQASCQCGPLGMQASCQCGLFGMQASCQCSPLGMQAPCQCSPLGAGGCATLTCISFWERTIHVVIRSRRGRGRNSRRLRRL